MSVCIRLSLKNSYIDYIAITSHFYWLSIYIYMYIYIHTKKKNSKKINSERRAVE